MRRLLSHTKSKNELTSFLAETFVDHEDKTTRCCGGLGCACRATNQDVHHIQSDEEEADTKMWFHALDATASCGYPFPRHLQFSSISKALSRAVCEDIVRHWRW